MSSALERGVAEVVERAEAHLLTDWVRGKRQQEPELTTSLVNTLEIFSTEVSDVLIEMKVLTSSGKGSEESIRGADVEGTMIINLGDEQVRKGFLAQAKLAGKDGMRLSDSVVVGKPSRGLADDCKQMLRETSASFVWIYDKAGIRVADAGAVHEQRSMPSGFRGTVATRSLAELYVDVASCREGDPTFTPTFAPGSLRRRRPNRMRLRISRRDR
jgi:hypothetical protein